MLFSMLLGYHQTTPAKARDLCARISSLLGYPRDGVTLDGVATSEAMTVSYVEPIAHPTDRLRAAVPIDDMIADLDDPAVQAAAATAGVLDASWEPQGAG